MHQIISLGWLPLAAVSCSSRASISNERSGEGEAAPPPGSAPSLLQQIVNSCILPVRYQDLVYWLWPGRSQMRSGSTSVVRFLERPLVLAGVDLKYLNINKGGNL